MVEQFIDGSTVTTLSAPITSTSTSLTVASSTAFPSIGQFRVRIENEILLVTNVSGITWTIERGLEGTAASAHSSGLNVDYVLTSGTIAQFRIDQYNSGTYSDLTSIINPVVGQTFWPTDSPFIYRYNGSIWERYGPIWRMSINNIDDGTWTTYSADIPIPETHNYNNGQLSITSTSTGSGQSNVLYYKTPPSQPYTVVMAARILGSATDRVEAGIGIMQASNNNLALHMRTFWPTVFLNSSFVPGWGFQVYYWTAGTFSSSELINSAVPAVKGWGGEVLWIKVQQGTTNRAFLISNDGFKWYTIVSWATANQWAVPDRIGICFRNTSGKTCQISVLHFDITSGIN